MTNEYEDKLEEIMSFVKMRLNEQNNRVIIRDAEDLGSLIKELDTTKNHDGKNRITDKFLQKIQLTTGARDLVGKTVGDRGKVRTVIGRKAIPPVPSKAQAKLQEKRKAGKTIFRAETPNKFVVRLMFTSRGKSMTRFQDIVSGRFVKKTVVREKV